MDEDDRKKVLAEAKASLLAADKAADAARRRVQEIEGVAKREDGVTKRDIAKATWVAPLVMSVNLPSSVFAGPAVSPVVTPTAAPGTPAPSVPTPAPSVPTPAPSVPTPAPSVPTPAPVTPS